MKPCLNWVLAVLSAAVFQFIIASNSMAQFIPNVHGDFLTNGTQAINHFYLKSGFEKSKAKMMRDAAGAYLNASPSMSPEDWAHRCAAQAEKYLRGAMLAHELGNVKTSIQLCRRAIIAARMSPHAVPYVNDARDFLKEYEKDAEAKLDLAQTLSVDGKHDEALQLLEKLRKHYSDLTISAKFSMAITKVRLQKAVA